VASGYIKYFLYGVVPTLLALDCRWRARLAFAGVRTELTSLKRTRVLRRGHAALSSAGSGAHSRAPVVGLLVEVPRVTSHTLRSSSAARGTQSSQLNGEPRNFFLRRDPKTDKADH
jgi:hypothetical protein